MLESLILVKTYLDQFCYDTYEVFGGRTIVYEVKPHYGVVVASVDSETDITVAGTCEHGGQWEKHPGNTVGVINLHDPDSLGRIRDLVLKLKSDIKERRFNFALPKRGD